MGVFGFFRKNVKNDIKPVVSCDNPASSRPAANGSGYNGADSNNPLTIVSGYNVQTDFQAAEAVRLPATVNAPVVTETGSLPAAVRAKAQERLTFVRRVAAVIERRACNAPDAVDYVALHHAGEFPVLSRSGKGGASALIYNNYRNWRKRIAGLTDIDAILRALCDDYARGYKIRKGDSRFWEYFHAFYLHQNRLTLKRSYFLACAKIRQTDKETRLPTYAQVRYQAARIDPGVLVLARMGEEAYKNMHMDFIRRDWSTIFPGQCLIGDSRTFDTRVRWWDKTQNKWIAIRPNIAGLLDARSWYLPAYWISPYPINSDMLINTLKLYMIQTGFAAPSYCYFDRGKDYCAKGFSKDLIVDGTPHSIFRELNIKLLNSIAYNARAKTIERAFRDMMQQFDKLFPDYLGSRPGERTLAADYYDTHAEELPSLEQFCEIFHRWLNDWHNTPKNGEIHKGKSPAELWSGLDRANQLSAERVFLAFYKPEAVRQVGRGPCVTWDKRYFYCDTVRVGDKVLVKSDPSDPEHILLCKPSGEIVGVGQTRDRINALGLDGEASRAAISASIARQRRQLRDACTMLSDLTGGRHLASPIELLLAPDGAEIVRGETIGKVKGAAHRYTHHAIPGAIKPAPAPAPAELPAAEPDAPGKYEFREEAEDARLDEIAEFAKHRQEKTEEEPEISEVYDFITNKQHKEEEYNEYE